MTEATVDCFDDNLGKLGLASTTRLLFNNDSNSSAADTVVDPALPAFIKDVGESSGVVEPQVP
jgi:hypothetical protein